MTGIIVTAIRAEGRPPWAELWRGYLDFREASLPDTVYAHTGNG